MARGKSTYLFNWRDHNRFELLINADKFYPRMLDDIQAATASILMEMYLFESGSVANRFIEAFIEAAKRGVAVKLLLDDFGTRGLSHFDRQRLMEAGIDIVSYNPLRLVKFTENMIRDHRKILIIDGKSVYVGGAGITDEFMPPDGKTKPWRENMLRISGPVVIDWLALFTRLWRKSTKKTLKIAADASAADVVNGMPGRVTVTNGLLKQEIMHSLIKRIRSAERRVWIATAYFVPPWKINRALRYAAGRGVDVRLLLPGQLTDHPAVRKAGRKYYEDLLRDGVRLFEYQRAVQHSKAILCDGWVSLGSCNLDRWNLRWNLEANQEIDNDDFADELCEIFETDFRNSLELQYSRWKRRPLLARLWDAVLHAYGVWLSRLGRGKRR
jgi:phosphatidylserine/phosphatidylglycerophosphate/cardiolipin synthase-like enzyme